ncbi:MAG: hypothetical protein QXI19_08560 [Candidatus Caldarchaeum sp.]
MYDEPDPAERPPEVNVRDPVFVETAESSDTSSIEAVIDLDLM